MPSPNEPTACSIQAQSASTFTQIFVVVLKTFRVRHRARSMQKKRWAQTTWLLRKGSRGTVNVAKQQRIETGRIDDLGGLVLLFPPKGRLA